MEMAAIHEYAKLSMEEKESLIMEEAVFLERYIDNENTICVYYLDDFFIEVIIKDGKTISNFPYKRGYRLDKKERHAIEKRNIFL